MAFFDLPLEKLREYRPDIAEPDDFDEFWADTFRRHAASDVALESEPVQTPLRLVDVHAVSWAGYGDHRVNGWLVLPRGVEGPLPAVVQFTGYSGGRGLPYDKLLFAAAGYAHFVIDARGQGWSTPSSHPATDDPEGRTGGSVPGVMTAGIARRETYYYRRLFVDAVRLVEAAASHERVDASRVVVAGGSQGGGIALAAAALAEHRGVRVAGCSPDYPFLCHFSRAIGLTDSYPYKEVADYLAVRPHEHEAALRTLSYFDGVSMARRIAAPGLFSVGLMDQTTPPSTVFAAYNHYAGSKHIEVYPFNGHEGGRGYQTERLLGWLAALP